MCSQALQCCLEAWVADVLGAFQQVGTGAGRALWRRDAATQAGTRRLYLEKDALQAAELGQTLQLVEQAALLVTQAGGPLAVGDDQQQDTLAPGGQPAERPGGRLQLAIQQLLQAVELLGAVQQVAQGLELAQQQSGCFGIEGAKRHGWTPHRSRHGSRCASWCTATVREAPFLTDISE